MGSRKVYEFHNEHAKKCDPDDVWRQIRRSVGGRAVDEEQIRMIETAILNGLHIEKSDVLLDLCCGNGALSDRIFARCSGGLGVDFSDYLIEVAQRKFARTGEREYVVGDVEAFVATTKDTDRFNKALCYGSFSYFADESAAHVLAGVSERFPHVECLFIGNLPDKARVDAYVNPSQEAPSVDDHESALGRWRTQAEFRALAAGCGWRTEFTAMPEAFYAAHYRYDAILTRS